MTGEDQDRERLNAEVDAELAEAERAFQAERQRLLATLPRLSDADELARLIDRVRPAAILLDDPYDLGTVVVRVDKESGEARISEPLAIIVDDEFCTARQLMAAAKRADEVGPYEAWESLPIRYLKGNFYSHDPDDRALFQPSFCKQPS